MNDSRSGISKWLPTFMAAGLLAAASAVAADAAGDAQAHAGELLRGTAAQPFNSLAPAQDPVGGRWAARNADAQHSAQRLLLGNSGAADPKLRVPLQLKASAASAWRSPQERRGRRDAQEQAHRLIQGRTA